MGVFGGITPMKTLNQLIRQNLSLGHIAPCRSGLGFSGSLNVAIRTLHITDGGDQADARGLLVGKTAEVCRQCSFLEVGDAPKKIQFIVGDADADSGVISFGTGALSGLIGKPLDGREVSTTLNLVLGLYLPGIEGGQAQVMVVGQRQLDEPHQAWIRMKTAPVTRNSPSPRFMKAP